MEFNLLKLFIFFFSFNYFIYCINFNKNSGKLILYIGNNLYKSYNISIHPILNYPFLLKYNFTVYQFNKNIFSDKNNIISNIGIGKTKNNNKNFFLYFLDDEESIINLILNKSIDSILSNNYLIISSYNISKAVVETLSYQIFYINKLDYISINTTIYQNISNLSIKLFYDNTDNLIPYKYIYYSKIIPFFSISILLLLNRIIFNRNKYYNLCFNSSILRLIYSFLYVCLISEKLKYNKVKYEYISGLSIDSLIDSLNNFVNDIYFSFIITCMIFIIKSEVNIINFFNLEERIIKVYFFIFLLISTINIPNYLFNQKTFIIFSKIDFLNLKLFLFEIFKTIILIYLIKKQINTISIILSIYSIYHLVNGFKILIIKKMFLRLIKSLFVIFLIFNQMIDNIIFRKYKSNTYYWSIIEKCTIENYTSIYLVIFWILLNINEDSNPLLHFYLNKVNNDSKKLQYYNFKIKNEITNNNYQEIKSNIKNGPIIILHPFINKINNNSFEKLNLGIIK